MSGLAALLAGHTQPGLYRWHNAAHVDDVAHAVEHARWRFAYLDGWTIEDRETFLKAACAALALPDYDGGSFDQLAERLDGVSTGDAHGTVLLWDGWSPLARHDDEGFHSVLSVFRRRVEDGEQGKMAVLLRGEGPDLEVPEIPDAPH